VRRKGIVTPLNRIGLTIVLLAVLLPVAACSKDPEVAKREHVARGDRYVAENKLAEAVIEYRNAVNLDARFGDARFKLGETYEKIGEARWKAGDIPERDAAYQNAFQEFLRAKELLPNRDDVQLKAARYLGDAGGFNESKAILEALLKKNPKNVDAQILLARSMVGLKDIPSAIKELESAIVQDPTRMDSYVGLGEVQRLNNNPVEAERALREALAAHPESVDVKLALAELSLAGRDPAKAESILTEILARQPKDERANNLLFRIYMSSGRLKEAEAPLRSLAASSTTVVPKMVLANYYFMMDRSGEALPILKELVKDKAARTPATLMLSQWEYAHGQQDSARKRIDDLLTQEPKNADALLAKARLLGSEGQIDEALVKAQAAAAAAPKRPEAPYWMGMFYLQKKDSDLALKSFNDALALNPADPYASLQVAKLQLAKLLQNGPATGADARSAADALRAVATSVDAVVRKQPGSLDARTTLIRALLAQAQVSQAVKDTVSAQAYVLQAEQKAARLVADAPKEPEAYNLVGAVALVKKDLPAARAAYASALELDKTSTTALAGLMGADLASGRPADAKAKLQARLAADPDNPALLNIAWRAYGAMGDTAKTEAERALAKTEQEAALRKLIQVEPSNFQAYEALVSLLYSQARVDEALRQLEQVVERNPKDVGALTAIGVILDTKNRTAEAQKKYEAVIQIDPNAAVAANNLAWIYAEQNVNLEVALQLAERAKSQLREDPQVDDTLGWVYYKKGLTALAISSFELSVRRDPKNPGYQYHLGLAYAQAGDKAKAREHLQKAAALGGGSKEAAEAKKFLATLG
jgi:tetratricopeptide (TPR) repeat protein